MILNRGFIEAFSMVFEPAMMVWSILPETLWKNLFSG